MEIWGLYPTQRLWNRFSAVPKVCRWEHGLWLQCAFCRCTVVAQLCIPFMLLCAPELPAAELNWAQLLSFCVFCEAPPQPSLIYRWGQIKGLDPNPFKVWTRLAQDLESSFAVYFSKICPKRNTAQPRAAAKTPYSSASALAPSSSDVPWFGTTLSGNCSVSLRAVLPFSSSEFP